MKTKFLLLLISTFLFIGCGNNKQVDPALAGTITDPPAVEVAKVADVRHDVWESISKTDCIKVNKGNVKPALLPIEWSGEKLGLMYMSIGDYILINIVNLIA
jgi:hypothetical protein